MTGHRLPILNGKLCQDIGYPVNIKKTVSFKSNGICTFFCQSFQSVTMIKRRWGMAGTESIKMEWRPCPTEATMRQGIQS